MYTKNYTKTFGDGTEEIITRYIADEGKVLFDGENYAKVVDDITGMTEVDEASEEDATISDYEAALKVLGVSE